MKYSKNDLIEFEKEIAELYNNAKIKAPIHLSGNNETQLINIFKKLKKMTGWSLIGVITIMHCFMVFQKISLRK